ncbi:MAG: hypothetical protein ABIU09_10885 [Pyrinomonadaceae bacterium]
MEGCFNSLRIGAAVFIVLSTFAILPALATAQPGAAVTFIEMVQTKTANRGLCKKSAACICSIAEEAVASRLLSEYGALFAAIETVKLPGRCIFENGSQVTEFQKGTRSRSEILSGVTVELQEEAMLALLSARFDAGKIGLQITPLDGSIAGKRTYSDTVRIWNSRYFKALDHWNRLGKISNDDARAARGDNVINQIRKVVKWERSGLNFGTNLKGSIFSSTAPPGASQHLSMLAFDVVQYFNRKIRAIMNQHGWFQTVVNDAPHFTYLGFPESRLKSKGLQMIKAGGYEYWVPLIQEAP